MITRILQKLALATAGTALSLAAFDVMPAKADIVNYDFNVFLFSTEEEANGSFSYDDTGIDPSQPFRVGLIDFSFNFRGSTFTKSNAETFGIGFTQYDFFEPPVTCPEECGFSLLGSGIWDALSLDFIIFYRGDEGVVINVDGEELFGGVGYSRVATPPVASVPEPGAGLGVLGLGAIGLAGSLKKKLAYSRRHSLPVPVKSIF